MADIYIAESVTFDIDLDASVTDTDYDLSGATLAYRLAPLGSLTAAVEVTPTVADAEAGRVTVALTDTDTAELVEGVYAYQLTDTDVPLLLASGTVTVGTLIGAVGTQPEAHLLDVTYSEYIARGYTSLDEAQWPAYRARARRTLRAITRERSEDLSLIAVDEADTAWLSGLLIEALCAGADAHFAASSGVVSEKLGSYSVTYGESASSPTYPASVMRSVLSGTGLTGLSL